jgi:hypothetical protein
MSSLSVIKEILEDKFLIANQNCLKEEDSDKNGKKFYLEYKIVKSNEIDYLIYRYDNEAFSFFKDVKDLKKMCDYILFAEVKNHLFIFTIELKSDNKSALKQLEAGSEFVKFIINSSNRIGKIISNYKIRKVRICNSKINKKRTNMSVEKGFEFDTNSYCDYKFKDFHLEPLTRY